MRKIVEPDEIAEAIELRLQKHSIERMLVNVGCEEEDSSNLLFAVANSEDVRQIADAIKIIRYEEPEKYNRSVALLAMELCLLALGYEVEFDEADDCCNALVNYIGNI